MAEQQTPRQQQSGPQSQQQSGPSTPPREAQPRAGEADHIRGGPLGPGSIPPSGGQQGPQPAPQPSAATQPSGQRQMTHPDNHVDARDKAARDAAQSPSPGTPGQAPPQPSGLPGQSPGHPRRADESAPAVDPIPVGSNPADGPHAPAPPGPRGPQPEPKR